MNTNVKPILFKMKKTISVLGMLAIFFSVQLAAQEKTQNKEAKQNGTMIQKQDKVHAQENANFVDEDGDGTNDNVQSANMTQNQNGYRYMGKQGEKARKGSLGFVDENGDGFNDNAQDADGDGIPNGQDPDYEGAMARNGANAKGFVDADGDGINDNATDTDGDGIPNGQDPDYERSRDGSGAQRGQRSGGNEDPGAGSGEGTGVGDGTGNGAAGTGDGTGVCDETGPKGKRGRR